MIISFNSSLFGVLGGPSNLLSSLLLVSYKKALLALTPCSRASGSSNHGGRRIASYTWHREQEKLQFGGTRSSSVFWNTLPSRRLGSSPVTGKPKEITLKSLANFGKRFFTVTCHPCWWMSNLSGKQDRYVDEESWYDSFRSFAPLNDHLICREVPIYAIGSNQFGENLII